MRDFKFFYDFIISIPDVVPTSLFYICLYIFAMKV